MAVFAGAGAASTTVIADAVFLLVGDVRMAGAEAVCDFAVILGALVFVADQQADRRSGGFAFEDAGKNLHTVRFPGVA